jgi:murein DD-endopeptidase MepM/ murein hydrolase activator NlpD
MSIIDSIQMSQRRQAMLGTEAAMSLLAPTAVAGLVVSIGDVMRDGKAIRYKKLLNSSFKKIKRAVMVANRDSSLPTIKLEAEESDAVEVLMQAVKSGVTTAVTTLCEGLFTFIPFAIETVVMPMFSIAVMGISAVLPLILTPEGLAVAAAAGAGIYLYKRWSDWQAGKYESPSSAPSTGPVSTAPESTLPANAPPSLRNNNPGNLVYAHQPSSLDTSGHFATFATQGQGLYNMGRQIELYSSRGINTVDTIVRTWSQTDQDAYVQNVATALGVKPDAKLDLMNESTLVTLMKAIIRQENGSNPYSDAQITEAARQALIFAANGYKDTTTTGDIRLVYPATGIVSSPFGHRAKPTEGASTEHRGVDIAGAAGTPILAAADGTVETEKVSSSYGNFIQLRHSSFWTRYGHMSKFAVAQGDSVVAGQKIGEMGSTGISTGAHLHFEVQPFTATAPVDPSFYLSGLGRGSNVSSSQVQPIATTSGDKSFVKKDGRIITLNS